MPLYDFSCSKCETEEEQNVKLADLDRTLFCSKCGGELERKFPTPRLSKDVPLELV